MMQKTIMTDEFKITIQVFEDRASIDQFVTALKTAGYELGNDETIQAHTYQTYFDGLGVIYCDSI